MERAKDMQMPGTFKTYQKAGTAYMETIYRDQVELALRKYLMKKEP